ncbi:hypothetical protein M426DRAFT_28780 [Hypoxylon sp. CI-4A]|nr:hypothetical protein M426DRAFT_28780 [Hypoxylon sp. CI-4A]
MDSSDHTQPDKLGIILHSIDDLMKDALATNETLLQQNAASPDNGLLRSRQSSLLEQFRTMMVTIHSKASKLTHDIETELEPIIAEASLEDLIGVDLKGGLNQSLGRMELAGKPCYKLRNAAPTIQIPRLMVEDGSSSSATSPTRPEDYVVVLDATLRNVAVIRHAYANIITHKEDLIKKYFDTVDNNILSSRKFKREQYEVLGMGALPKTSYGNLLDIKHSSHHQSTHDMMIALAVEAPNGEVQYLEAVSNQKFKSGLVGKTNDYLVLPVAEATLKMLYDTYKSLRQVTSDQRRATRDKAFASTQPADEVDELTNQFNLTTDDDPGLTSDGPRKKRHRQN